jgi:hypothetical protein
MNDCKFKFLIFKVQIYKSSLLYRKINGIYLFYTPLGLIISVEPVAFNKS